MNDRILDTRLGRRQMLGGLAAGSALLASGVACSVIPANKLPAPPGSL